MKGASSDKLHGKTMAIASNKYWRCDIKGASSGKLRGKTVAIKDNTCVAGVPMMNGSRTLEGFVPDVDATVVSRILDAGGHIVGKSVCEDLCCSGGSFTAATGPVVNPHNKTRMCGGSSSGSAALAMAGYDGGLDPRQPRDLKVPEYTLGVGLLLNFIGDESFIGNNMAFRHGSNAITPRPNWPISHHVGNVYQSTTPPVSETDYNAMEFNLWKSLGSEFMVKSNINHWIACKEGTGSLVEFKTGSVLCRIIKNVASKCHNYVPDQLILHAAGNPAGSTLGPDLIRSQSSSWLKEYYYFESNTRTGNWPTHDPCGTNSLNHLTNVNNPHGNIYIR
ncbi:hypothetical protein pdam_00023471 [Pocillopora damicornis]|uniref:Amidase domain-containing protein n=1 Tax=Pocillopora damicornis TaxID=46731 RepID=A0A3M6UXY8_POCDA|nr:hypothetical protein pdam_00023471 [Pocillopora damicornis]